MPEKRADGYYWFRNGTNWEIALWECEKWHFLNDEYSYPFTPDFMHQILDERIDPPKNSQL